MTICLCLLQTSMASLLSVSCSLPIQPPSQRSLSLTASIQTSSPQKNSSSSSSSTRGNDSLKPIVVDGDPPTFVSAPGRRIVAVGDLHGDLKKTRSALEMAGLISSDGRDLWIGGETVLIQLGDILDRGEDEIAILSLLKSLDITARANGGAVFQVNGNHETMNVEGDYRYVESGAYDECTDFLEHLNAYGHHWEEAFLQWIRVSETWKEKRKMSKSYWEPFNLVKRQKGIIARSVLLRPGGPLSSELARHAVVLKVDDWVFCHGGVLPHHVYYGIERMNREVSHWMRGVGDEDGHEHIPFIATRGYDSVVWNRLYSSDICYMHEYQIDQIESTLEKTLEALGAKAMVVGHTPQPNGANCEFNCNVWRIDVGMSVGVLDSHPEVLEIRDNKARVVRSKRDRFNELQVIDYT